MKHIFEVPLIYLTLLTILLILAWSALVRFPWFVLVGILVLGVLALRSGRHEKEEEG